MDLDGAFTAPYGYSKNKDKGLKQFLISMITCDNLPVFISTLSGNKSDKVSLREMTKKYGESIMSSFDESKTFVFDSAFYSASTVRSCNFPWITRVPENISEAKNMLLNLEADMMHSCKLTGYKLYSTEVTYAGIKQRWIMVFSSKAYKKEKKSMNDLVIKEADKLNKKAWHFSNVNFESKIDGLKKANILGSKAKYHRISSIETKVVLRRKLKKRGRPKKNEIMVESYQFNVKFEVDEAVMKKEMKKKGRFIVATNILDGISDEECLTAYKDQQKVERGFRFIKDPMFFVDGIYLKNENRIISMVMLMGISLLIYSLLEKKIRYSFGQTDELYNDGYREATKNPTMKRVLLTMEDIHLHCISFDDKIVDEKIKNIRPETLQVLKLLGPEFKKCMLIVLVMWK